MSAQAARRVCQHDLAMKVLSPKCGPRRHLRSTAVLGHAIIGVRAETPHCCEEKTTKLDAVPVAGTNRLLPRIRSKTSRIIAPVPLRK